MPRPCFRNCVTKSSNDPLATVNVEALPFLRRQLARLALAGGGQDIDGPEPGGTRGCDDNLLPVRGESEIRGLLIRLLLPAEPRQLLAAARIPEPDGFVVRPGDVPLAGRVPSLAARSLPSTPTNPIPRPLILAE